MLSGWRFIVFAVGTVAATSVLVHAAFALIDRWRQHQDGRGTSTRKRSWIGRGSSRS
jgi:hypothetical protein